MSQVALPVAFGNLDEDDLLIGNRPARRSLGTSDYRPFMAEVLAERGFVGLRTASLVEYNDAKKEAQRLADQAWLAREQSTLRAKGRHFIDRSGPRCGECGEKAPMRVSQSGVLVGECCATDREAVIQFELIRVVSEDSE